jgi:hypothetical protein
MASWARQHIMARQLQAGQCAVYTAINTTCNAHQMVDTGPQSEYSGDKAKTLKASGDAPPAGSQRTQPEYQRSVSFKDAPPPGGTPRRKRRASMTMVYTGPQSESSEYSGDKSKSAKAAGDASSGSQRTQHEWGGVTPFRKRRTSMTMVYTGPQSESSGDKPKAEKAAGGVSSGSQRTQPEWDGVTTLRKRRASMTMVDTDPQSECSGDKSKTVKAAGDASTGSQRTQPEYPRSVSFKDAPPPGGTPRIKRRASMTMVDTGPQSGSSDYPGDKSKTAKAAGDASSGSQRTQPEYQRSVPFKDAPPPGGTPRRKRRASMTMVG